MTGTLREETENIEAVWYLPLQWPGRPYDDDALPWIDWAKNNIQYNHDGKMCVSIAQHTNGIWSSDPYLYPGKQFFAVVAGNLQILSTTGPMKKTQ